jgi:hypothetical protein
MNPFRIAFAFIKIPRLFIALLFWPMIIGILIAIIQAMATSIYVNLSSETVEQYQNRVLSDSYETNWVREKLFHTRKDLPPLRICIWKNKVHEPGCDIEPYDIVMRNENPTEVEITNLKNFYSGSTRKVHFCKDCSSEIIMTPAKGKNEEVTTRIFGFSAIGVYFLTDHAKRNLANVHYIEAKETIEVFKDSIGTIYLHPPGLKYPINVTHGTKIMILIINAALIAIITLWLTLKGHRKVLDYFSKNGALLPLVAACGKERFYASLWIMTILRVGFFLLTVLPATIILYLYSVPEETHAIFFKSPAEFSIYLFGLISGLSCIGIIGSIAELKQRHSLVSFSYKYLPIILCLTGTGIWLLCIFIPGDTAKIVRSFISAIPVLGITPVLVSPLITLEQTILSIHSILSSLLVLILFRYNASWFAAHIEEL